MQLDSVLDAVSEAQQRARVALLIALLASGTIMIAEWNSYFSWDRRWAEVNPTAPTEWGQEKVLESQIANWQDANAVDVSLLGIRVSVNDAAVVGSLILVVAAFYLSMCLRAENLEIGTLLHQMKDDADGERKWLVFNRIRSGMVFLRAETSDAAYETLAARPARQTRIPFAGAVLRLLVFLPAIACAIIIASDVYFAVAYTDSWKHLEQKYRIQLIATDAFALVCLALIATFLVSSWRYWHGTRQIVREFEATLP